MNSDECPICMEQISNKVVCSNNHSMCLSCIEQHFKPECCICRVKMNFKPQGNLPVPDFEYTSIYDHFDSNQTQDSENHVINHDNFSEPSETASEEVSITSDIKKLIFHETLDHVVGSDVWWDTLERLDD